MRNKRLLRVALESRIEEITAEVVPADDAVVAQVDTVVPVGDSIVVVDSSDVELEAVQRAQSDTVDTVDAISQLVQAADQLEGVRSNIAATLPNGGLTQGEAVAYATATDVITADLGVKDVIPAMENFGGSMSRLQATQESLNAVTDVMKRVAARALELLEKLLDRIIALAVRIVEYFTSDKSRLEKYSKILEKSSRSGSYTFKVASDTATLLGLAGGNKSASELETLCATLLQTSQAAVVAATDETPTEILGKASAVKSVLAGSTTKDGNKIKTKQVNGVQLIETMPTGDDDFTSYDLEIVTPDVGDNAVEVTVTHADLAALCKFLNSISIKPLKDVTSSAKGAAIGAKIASWVGTKATSDEEAKEALENWRHLVLTRAGIAPAALGAMQRIVQGAMSVLSKGTAQMASGSGEKLGLPNKA